MSPRACNRGSPYFFGVAIGKIQRTSGLIEHFFVNCSLSNAHPKVLFKIF